MGMVGVDDPAEVLEPSQCWRGSLATGGGEGIEFGWLSAWRLYDSRNVVHHRLHRVGRRGEVVVKFGGGIGEAAASGLACRGGGGASQACRNAVILRIATRARPGAAASSSGPSGRSRSRWRRGRGECVGGWVRDRPWCQPWLDWCSVVCIW